LKAKNNFPSPETLGKKRALKIKFRLKLNLEALIKGKRSKLGVKS